MRERYRAGLVTFVKTGIPIVDTSIEGMDDLAYWNYLRAHVHISLTAQEYCNEEFNVLAQRLHVPVQNLGTYFSTFVLNNSGDDDDGDDHVGVTCMCCINANRIACGKWSGRVITWDVLGTGPNVVHDVHQDCVTGVCRVRGDVLVSVGADRRMLFTPPITGPLTEQVVDYPFDCVCAIDEDVIATGSRDGFVRVWNTENVHDVHVLREFGHSVGTEWVLSVCRIDDNRLASAGGSGIVKVWKINLGPNETNPVRQRDDQAAQINCICYMHYSRIAIGNAIGNLKIWNFDAPHGNQNPETIAFNPHLSVHSICSIGRNRMLTSAGRQVRSWDVNNIPTPARVDSVRDAPAGPVCSIDANRVAYAHGNVVTIMNTIAAFR